LNQTLIEDFCIQPKIAVLGLNPHAGDGGVIGNEEIEIIAPAIKELSDNGILAFGPFPADSFSSPVNIKFRCCFSDVSRPGTGSFQNTGL
jgi:4-hydroxythreonine-4-phosphate dehydrogenase